MYHAHTYNVPATHTNTHNPVTISGVKSDGQVKNGKLFTVESSLVGT